MSLPALQTAPPARPDAPPLVPIDLAHYRARWPSYLARVDDRDIVAAVLVGTAWRRRTWPTNERARHWCEMEEPDLLAYLDDVAARDAWHEVHEVRRQSGGLVAPVWLPMPGDRRYGAERVASFAVAVPRMRALGSLLATDGNGGPSLDLGLDSTATATGGGDEGGGGGRKGKPTPKPDEEPEDGDTLALRADDIEALGFEVPKPPWA